MVRTLHAVNKQLCRLRGRISGGSPWSFVCGDFQHDKSHALWKRFTTVVMLDEQLRAPIRRACWLRLVARHAGGLLIAVARCGLKTVARGSW